MPVLNWLDTLFFGYRRVLDPDDVELAERHTMKFSGNVIVTDDPLLGVTEIQVNSDVSTATPLPIPDTIVKRDGAGGAGFGGVLTAQTLSAVAMSSTTLSVFGDSDLSQCRATSYLLRFSGTDVMSISHSAGTTTQNAVGHWTMKTQNSSTSFSGLINIFSGNTTVGSNPTGPISIFSGDAEVGNTGNITIRTGTANTTGPAQTTGSLLFSTGQAAGTSGGMQFTVGPASGTGGDILFGISSALNTGSFRVSIANSTGGTTGSAVFNIGSIANRGNFIIGVTNATPVLSGAKGVLFMHTVQTAPAVDSGLVGAMMYVDAAGFVYLRTKLGLKTLNAP